MNEYVSVSIKRNIKGPSSHKAVFQRKDGRSKTVNFGLKGAKTFINNADEKTRQNYLKRHAVRENWEVPDTAGSLSARIKWGSSKNISKNIRAFKKRFKLK
jgi:hypothetical protein